MILLLALFSSFSSILMKAKFWDKYLLKSVWLFVHSMLMALPPVILLPITHFVYGERIGWQAIFGTVLAILGVTTFFLA